MQEKDRSVNLLACNNLSSLCQKADRQSILVMIGLVEIQFDDLREVGDGRSWPLVSIGLISILTQSDGYGDVQRSSKNPKKYI